MLKPEFFSSLPDDVAALVSQRTLFLPLSPLRPDGAKQSHLQRLRELPEWKNRFTANSDMASAALSGVWLWFGFLDTAHQLCQDIPTAEGSYWHGIMHRIEGDYWNAKYWMRRVGKHEVHRAIPTNCKTWIVGHLDSGVAKLAMPNTVWNAEGFVDACEKANTGPIDATQIDATQIDGANVNTAEDCQRLATVEWLCLMQYCLSDIHY